LANRIALEAYHDSEDEHEDDQLSEVTIDLLEGFPEGVRSLGAVVGDGGFVWLG
jgi:hypothetical protein